MELIILLVILIIEVIRYVEWHDLYLHLKMDEPETAPPTEHPKVKGKKYRSRLELVRLVNRGD